MSQRNGESGMSKMWAAMTPEDRKARVDAMQAGRKRSQSRKRRQQKLVTRHEPAEDLLELTKHAIQFLNIAGSRKEADRALELAELVGGIYSND